MNSLPVHLITGLLGSGKTTTLCHLLAQKPQGETWGLIINEFGEIDIDAATLKASQSSADNSTQDSTENSTKDRILSVSGGCVCCTAQHGLTQAINQLLTSDICNHPLSRIWIEPTGLGHPAKIIDTLLSNCFLRPLALQKVVCVITPKQLTPERWQKSQVMRDLVTLSDCVLLNKIDLAAQTEIDQAYEVLKNGCPTSLSITQMQQGITDILPLITQKTGPNQALFSNFKPLKQANLKQPGLVVSNLSDAHLAEYQALERSSELPGVTRCIHKILAQPNANITERTTMNTSVNTTKQLNAIGWVFSPDIQFNRIKLKAFFAVLSPLLSRAKGLLKTGIEWQLINWTEDSLSFEDIAWRQDSRLELLFKDVDEHPLTPSLLSNLIKPNVIESHLLRCINPPKLRS